MLIKAGGQRILSKSIEGRIFLQGTMRCDIDQSGALQSAAAVDIED